MDSNKQQERSSKRSGARLNSKHAVTTWSIQPLSLSSPSPRAVKHYSGECCSDVAAPEAAEAQ